LNDHFRISRGALETHGSRDSRLLRGVPYAIGFVIVLGIGAGTYLWKKGEQREASPEAPPQRAEAPQPEAQSAAPPQSPPAVSTEPQIHHPLPAITPPSGLAGKPVPPLAESDQAVQEALVAPLGQRAVSEIVISKDIARRIVATVDNLPRQRAGAQLLPVKAPATSMIASRKGDIVTLSPANYARYTSYVRLAQAVNVKQLVALYVHFYPLFQQAYEELGYPKKYFNDRLIEVIDDLLAAPDMQGPVQLVRPKVMYQFADPELEELSAGQKVLIRIGPDSAAVIKAKLRELRRELAVEGPAQ